MLAPYSQAEVELKLLAADNHAKLPTESTKKLTDKYLNLTEQKDLYSWGTLSTYKIPGPPISYLVKATIRNKKSYGVTIFFLQLTTDLQLITISSLDPRIEQVETEHY